MKHLLPQSVRRRFLLTNALALVLGTMFVGLACSDDDVKLPPATGAVGEPGGQGVVRDAGASPDGATATDADTSGDGASENDGSADGSLDGSDASEADDGSAPQDGSPDVDAGEPPPDGRCRQTSDCTNPKFGCFFRESPNCDPATTQYCMNAAECGEGFRCAPPRKSCGAACLPLCTSNADCAIGETCGGNADAGGDCYVSTCNSKADCPNANFDCKASRQGGRCARIACTKDSQCAGRCVVEKDALSGYCLEDWGFCATP